ncbi:MAG: PhzF family phenazine biosynthesis protein [Caldiserica bacterium]|nr:PhzF family phenazine biosynthesis protein [Caldisericota bacterium]
MKYYVIDAFTDKLFAGNPAAVCLLQEPLTDEVMASIAREMNLSETAFVLWEGDAWRLRWFTPAVEVPLCGHGTLATARALREAGIVKGDEVYFRSLSGDLAARYHGDWIELDFPSLPPSPAPVPSAVLDALGIETTPRWTGVNAHRYWLLDLGPAAAVRALAPNRAATMGLDLPGIVVTGAGDAPYDFTSRFFAPADGIFEDPVTGSAHAALTPYWSSVLGRTSFVAYQASSRGGILKVRLAGDRVLIAGKSVVVATGNLRIP